MTSILSFLILNCGKVSQITNKLALNLWLSLSSGTRDSWYSVQFSRSVVSDSLQPMDCRTPVFPVLHHLPEFSQTHVHLVTGASNHLILCVPFSSCPQSFPASGSFPMSQLFTSGGQSTGASISASVLPMNIQGWLRWLGIAISDSIGTMGEIWTWKYMLGNSTVFTLKFWIWL